MATTTGNDDFDVVQPKPAKNLSNGAHENKLEQLKKKAFVPSALPEDFLRVVLNQQQLNENNDSALAHRLQYGYSPREVPYADPAHRSRVVAQTIGRGRLQMEIVEAKLAKNYGLITRMDPYVRLRLGSKVFETPTDYNGGKNPRWRKTVMAYVQPEVDMVSIEIFDEKSFTNDELVAFANFPLPESLFEGIFLDEWIPLSGKLGEDKEGYINIQFLFTPAENLRHPFHQSGGPVPGHVPRIVPNQSSTSSSSSSSKSTSLSPSNSQNTALNQPRQVQLPPEAQNNTNNAAGPDAGETLRRTTAQTVHSAPRPVDLFTEADLADVKEMFPTFETDVIKSIMNANQGNKEASIEALLAMSVADT